MAASCGCSLTPLCETSASVLSCGLYLVTLARDVADYKALLMAADEPHRRDLGGCGNLTEAGLVRFCEFFLTRSIDQVSFVESILEPPELLRRMEIWCEEVSARRLQKGSWPLPREAVIVGEFARGQAPSLTGYQERQAGTVLNTLKRDVLLSPKSRSKGRFGFPSEVVERWLPRLNLAMNTTTADGGCATRTAGGQASRQKSKFSNVLVEF